jgi:hypothetical protein
MPPVRVKWEGLLLFMFLLIYSARATDFLELRTPKYTPPSAHACRVVVANVKLSCSNSTEVTSPKCYASNLPFLSTLAVCLHTHVIGLTTEQLEEWWQKWAVGWSPNQPSPSINFSQAIDLALLPTVNMLKGMTLTNALLITDEDYQSAYALVMDWNENERFHETFT